MVSSMVDRRVLPLSGVRNARDLGGYASRFGGAVRWGRVYRSGRLDGLSPDDVAVLRSLDLSLVYDLRSARERDAAPDTVPSLHVPLIAEGSPDSFGLDRIVDHASGVDVLVEMNLALLERSGAEIGAILFSLADRTRTPMLFHCTAGKDRTGLVAALLLDVLGVDREDVLDDYERSALDHRPAELLASFERFSGWDIPPEALAGLLAAPREVMSSVLDTLDDRYGGAERYLSEHGAIDRGAIEMIRRLLLH